MLNIESIRRQFPILKETVNGNPLVYFDNAASTQKPLRVLEKSRQYYETLNANIHRGVHTLSQRATAAHEEARRTVARFVNAAEPCEIIFTSGCTDSINMVAQILGSSSLLRPGDEIIISTLEHHSNIVPWQMLCERTGACLRVIRALDSGELDEAHYLSLLSPRTRVLALGHVSNALGLINPVERFTAAAKRNNPDTLVLIDGAQSAPHMPIDVQGMGCDFFAFSGHKLYAPTGIGVLWGRRAVLDSLPPWKGGGEMIREVTFEKTTYNDLPFKYEAGTPNIEGAIALAEAIDFMEETGPDAIARHELALTHRCLDGLASVEGLQVFGTARDRGAVVSFLVDGVHHYDLGVLLDQMGIAVRTGHHCCQPLMARYGITGTVRASFAVYNTAEEVDRFLQCLDRALAMLR